MFSSTGSRPRGPGAALHSRHGHRGRARGTERAGCGWARTEPAPSGPSGTSAGKGPQIQQNRLIASLNSIFLPISVRLRRAPEHALPRHGNGEKCVGINEMSGRRGRRGSPGHSAAAAGSVSRNPPVLGAPGIENAPRERLRGEETRASPGAGGPRLAACRDRAACDRLGINADGTPGTEPAPVNERSVM